ncbi:MAG: hypothetical protein IT204_16520 [Fimbriimonadaceae bacterium]|nr:hypothetical protein [Fimbriimonadaceae bacterium]
MRADELVEQLQHCPDEALAPHLETLSQLVDRIRRRAAGQRLVALARAAAAAHREDPPMDEDDLRAYLGRDRDCAWSPCY